MTDVTNPTPASEIPVALAAAPARREISILIVDDEPGVRNFLQRPLAKEYGLVEAVEHVEAAEALRARCRFDVLIVDISLPGRSGLEWVEALHRSGDRSNVIFITAYADLNTTIGALRAGAVDFILKPFRVEQLLAAVRRCVAQRAPVRERVDGGRLGGTPAYAAGTEMIGRSPAIS